MNTRTPARACFDSLEVIAIEWRRGNFFWRVARFCSDVLHLRAWRDMDLIAGIFLAAFLAMLAQPFVPAALAMTCGALNVPLR